MSAVSLQGEQLSYPVTVTLSKLFKPTPRDAKKARPRKRRTALVKGEASHTSGRQTDYRRKAGQRNNVDMGEAGVKLDGSRRMCKFLLLPRRMLMISRDHQRRPGDSEAGHRCGNRTPDKGGPQQDWRKEDGYGQVGGGASMVQRQHSRQDCQVEIVSYRARISGWPVSGLRTRPSD